MRFPELHTAAFAHPSLLAHDPSAIRFRRWRKWRMMASYLWNVPRIGRFRHLGAELGIRIPCEDALLAAFSACHLVGMTFRQTCDSRMLELLTKIWLAFVNFDPSSTVRGPIGTGNCCFSREFPGSGSSETQNLVPRFS
jgi:hypothetical protein